MRNIVLCRIDDRLIHGQVVTAWVKQTNGNRIIIIDEALTKDAFMQKIIKAAAPAGIQVDIFSCAQAADVLKEDADGREKIIILVKTPQVLEKLIDEGVTLEKIILGGMGAKEGRTKFNKNVSANVEEVECMKRITQKNVPMYFQLVPTEKATDVQKLLG